MDATTAPTMEIVKVRSRVVLLDATPTAIHAMEETSKSPSIGQCQMLRLKMKMTINRKHRDHQVLAPKYESIGGVCIG